MGVRDVRGACRRTRRSRAHGRGHNVHARSANRRLAAGRGRAAGAAVLIRFDFAPAVVLSRFRLLSSCQPGERGGTSADSRAPQAICLSSRARGPGGIARVVSDVVASAPGRGFRSRDLSRTPGALSCLGARLAAFLVVGGAVL